MPLKLRAWLLAVGFLATGCVPFVAQQTPAVAGRVVDSRSGKGIAGARVGFVKFNSASRLTDRTGHFSLPATHRLDVALLFVPMDRFPGPVTFEVREIRYKLYQTAYLDADKPHDFLSIPLNSLK
jgi:hypothetical protein